MFGYICKTIFISEIDKSEFNVEKVPRLNTAIDDLGMCEEYITQGSYVSANCHDHKANENYYLFILFKL